MPTKQDKRNRMSEQQTNLIRSALHGIRRNGDLDIETLELVKNAIVRKKDRIVEKKSEKFNPSDLKDFVKNKASLLGSVSFWGKRLKNTVRERIF